MRFMYFYTASAACSALLLLSCSTTPISISQSSIPLYDKTVTENLGRVEGTDSAYSVLGLWMIGRPDIERAMNAAIKQKNGDALINIRCYETWSYYILFSRDTVMVEGEAIKLIQDSAAKSVKPGKKR